MRKLVFLSDKFPADSPVRRAAEDLGFEVSGFIPPGKYLNHTTLKINVSVLDALMVEMDSLINPGLPLELDMEHNATFEGAGPITPFEYMHLKLNTIARVKTNHPHRLVLNWGDPKPISRWAARSASTLTCAAESAYWRNTQSTGEWKWAAKQRRMYADVYELPTVLYVAPILWDMKQGRHKRLNSGAWNHVINYVIERDPEMVEFWVNQDKKKGITDTFLISALKRLAAGIK